MIRIQRRRGRLDVPAAAVVVGGPWTMIALWVLAPAALLAGETKPAASPELTQKVGQLVEELVNPPAAEPDAEAAGDIEATVARFGSNDFQTREAASKAILKRGTVALEALRRALGSKDPEVVERAERAIAAIGSETRAAVCGKVRSLGEAGKKEVARQLAAATTEISVLAAPKKPEEEKAMEADLAARRTKAAAVWKRVGALAELLAAAWGLNVGSADAAAQAAQLMNVLRDKDAGKRTAAVWALGVADANQSGTGINYLGRVLRDQDAGVRQAVAWAIGLSGQANVGNGQAFLQILGQNADAELRKAIEAVKELPRQ